MLYYYYTELFQNTGNFGLFSDYSFILLVIPIILVFLITVKRKLLGNVIAGFLLLTIVLINTKLRQKVEYILMDHTIILVAMFGIIVSMETTDMLTIFVALEMQAFSFYTLVSLKKDNLFATALIYQNTGFNDIALIADLLPITDNIGTSFHLWLPDACYTLIFIAIFLLFTLNNVMQQDNVIFMTCILSGIVGSIQAASQTKVKRFLAYGIIFNNCYFLAILLIAGKQASLGLLESMGLYIIVSFLILITIHTFVNATVFFYTKIIYFKRNLNNVLSLRLTILQQFFYKKNTLICFLPLSLTVNDAIPIPLNFFWKVSIYLSLFVGLLNFTGFLSNYNYYFCLLYYKFLNLTFMRPITIFSSWLYLKLYDKDNADTFLMIILFSMLIMVFGGMLRISIYSNTAWQFASNFANLITILLLIIISNNALFKGCLSLGRIATQLYFKTGEFHKTPLINYINSEHLQEAIHALRQGGKSRWQSLFQQRPQYKPSSLLIPTDQERMHATNQRLLSNEQKVKIIGAISGLAVALVGGFTLYDNHLHNVQTTVLQAEANANQKTANDIQQKLLTEQICQNDRNDRLDALAQKNKQTELDEKAKSWYKRL